MTQLVAATSREPSTCVPDLTFPVPATPHLCDDFNEKSVRIVVNGAPVDVAVPDAMFARYRDEQHVIANELGGWIPTRAENLEVARYLLALKEVGPITKNHEALLEVYLTCWVNDTQGRIRVCDGEVIQADISLYEKVGFTPGKYSTNRMALVLRSPPE